MKKKGFTLIELLAVIVVLAILAFILVPIIQDLISNARYAAAADSALNYVHAANTQVSTDVGGFEEFTLFPSNSRLETGVTDSELDKIKYSGKGPDYVYLHFTEDGKLVDWANFCMWGYSIDYTMTEGAAKSNSDYCSPKAVVKDHYDAGDAIYYNVTSGTQCTKEQYDYNVSEWGKHANYMYIADQMISRGMEQYPDGLHSGCMKFYSIGDDGNNLTLLTAFNINEIGPDKNETDSSKYGDRVVYWADIKEGSTKQNVKDFNNITNPQANTYYVMDLLKNYTKDWKTNGVNDDYTSTYTYTVDGEEVTDSYTLPYKTDGYKARLLTKVEITEIAGGNNKDILKDNLYQHPQPYIYHPDGSKTMNNGFYTADANNNTDMYLMDSWLYPTSSNGQSSQYSYGVRPVIEISKNNLKSSDTSTPRLAPTIAEGSGSGGSNTYTKYESGSTLYFNVTTGTECTKGEADINLSSRHTPVGVKSGCMKFYVLPDSTNKETVSLILDHPTTWEPVYWFEAANSLLGPYVTILPPMSILAQIYSDTNDWQGVEIIDNYTMTTTQGSSYQETYTTTIPYKTLGLKARLIRTEEIDGVLHANPTLFNDSYQSSNKRKELSYYLGFRWYGSNNPCYDGSSYSSICNPYGTIGHRISEVSWVVKDYGRDEAFIASTREPNAEYLDFYDGIKETFMNDYTGSFWTSSYATDDTSHDGPWVTLISNGTDWDTYTPKPHMFRPVIEVKKSKFGGAVKENDIEISVGGTYTPSFGDNYSILDSTIATVDGTGKITGLKVGVTQVKASNGHYAKLVVNHAPNTYYSSVSYAYYNVNTGTMCDSSSARCYNDSGCRLFEIIGETASGNYLMANSVGNSAMMPTLKPENLFGNDDMIASKFQWSARWAIDDDANAVSKYGAMAYNHWYKLLEYVADFTKNWNAAIPTDYVDYTTKEYVIPWSTPAYYENGNPVYAKARLLTMEDAAGLTAVWDKQYFFPSVYEMLHNTGSSVFINSGKPYSNTYPGTAVGDLIAIRNYDRSSNTYYFGGYPNYIVIEVPKTSITSTTDSKEDYVIRSTSDSMLLGATSVIWSQSSTDGGEVEFKIINVCSGGYCYNQYYVFGKKNGHVHISSNYGNEYDITVDLQASCGQVDMCGRTTAACN